MKSVNSSGVVRADVEKVIRVVDVVAREMHIDPRSRDYRVLADKTATLSRAFPDEHYLLGLLRRSARILLKTGDDGNPDDRE
jgi:hypothetical protein